MDENRILAGLREAETLAAGYGPTAADLEAAPVLGGWVLSTDRLSLGSTLTGVVAGHPRLADGHVVVTSVVLAISVQHGWARTVSRYCRLGQPRRSAFC